MNALPLKYKERWVVGVIKGGERESVQRETVVLFTCTLMTISFFFTCAFQGGGRGVCVCGEGFLDNQIRKTSQRVD